MASTAAARQDERWNAPEPLPTRFSMPEREVSRATTLARDNQPCAAQRPDATRQQLLPTASLEHTDARGTAGHSYPVQSNAIFSFIPLQEWEGYVTEVGNDSFKARLIDVTSNDELEAEEAELLCADLSDDDRVRLHPGAVFRWTIGYQIKKGKPRVRASQVVFRRLAALTGDQREQAFLRGAERVETIKWE